ncbi:uncharacterized protein BDV14DRAFT_178410 [Aspergillus stella-maris]|uniref:uncharacterized protein n=1 Tax=Aspergillus stella-maris TaxID=1810926 RepID=UPI003CCDDBDF
MNTKLLLGVNTLGHSCSPWDHHSPPLQLYSEGRVCHDTKKDALILRLQTLSESTMRRCALAVSPLIFSQGADQVSHRLARVCGGQRLIGAIFCEFKTVEPYGDDSGFLRLIAERHGQEFEG